MGKRARSVKVEPSAAEDVAEVKEDTCCPKRRSGWIHDMITSVHSLCNDDNGVHPAKLTEEFFENGEKVVEATACLAEFYKALQLVMAFPKLGSEAHLTSCLS